MSPYQPTAELMASKYPSSIANSVYDDTVLHSDPFCFVTADEQGVVLVEPVTTIALSTPAGHKFPQADLRNRLEVLIGSIELLDNTERGRKATATLLNALGVWSIDFQLNR